MHKTGKYQQLQMNLGGEWGPGSLPVSGRDVFSQRTGKVSQQWLSACQKERTSTQDMMERITDLSNLSAACRKVIKNGGSPGVDGMTTNDLREWFGLHHQQIAKSLLSGTYRPSPVKLVTIPKPSGGTRQLGIPTVIDRMVQQAVLQTLTRRYEPIFSESSYGFRPGRSAHQALQKAGRNTSEGYRYCVDLDLEKFFDKVNHDRLMWQLSLRIGDSRLLSLIRQMLKSGMMVGGVVSQRISGTPQGSPLSPLLSNIVLDELDKELELRGHRFVRYADDLIIQVRSEESGNRVYSSIKKFIEERMLLSVNEGKSKVCRCSSVNFLGHRILYDGGLGLSDPSEDRFKSKVRQITRRNRGVSFAQLVGEVNRLIRGWLNYFRHARMRSKLVSLTSWVCRRLRCFRLKQCKRGKGITRLLVNCGIPKWRAILLGSSHKGWFRKSGSPPAHEAMSHAWFRQMGLILPTDYYRQIFRETAQYESTLGGVRGRQS
jgi:group II intron reverse transcriptase/maturase